MPQQTIVITGSTGFIGGYLCKDFERRGYEVFAIVRRPESARSEKEILCDLTNTSKLKIVLEELNPDFVVSVAGRTGPGRDLNDFASHYEDNVLPALSVAKAVPPSVKLTLFFGSCEEYGNGQTPFVEEQALRAFSPYGWGKISAYYSATLTCRERGVPFCWLRPFLTFGPGQDTSQLIPSIIRACKGDLELPLTLGEQTRDFIFIEDLAEMIAQILKIPALAKNEVLNLGSGVPRTVRSVGELIRSKVGRGNLRFGALLYRSDEAMSFYASMEKYTKLYGPAPIKGFDEAIERVLETQIQVKEKPFVANT